MKKLYLDDTRVPDPSLGFDHVKDYESFVDYILRNGLPDEISFDHDLAYEHVRDYLNHKDGPLNYKSYEEKTGFDAAKWIVRFCMNNELIVPKTYCHSMNTVGSVNIRTYLNNYYRMKKVDRSCDQIIWKHKIISRDESKNTSQ
jgi:hypothetical protein